MVINPKKRKRKAYRVSLMILFSYLRLFLLKRFFSASKYERKRESLHLKNAKFAKATILELDGLFIKVGQLLSIMSSFLPEAYGAVLESLQDNTPASSFEAVKSTIESELGEPIVVLFQSFEEAPIASASIGQVHRAVLKSGEQVAVKVQHPQIETLAELDLNIIEGLIKLILRFFKINGLDHVYVQVRQMIQEELDYNQEAKSLAIIGQNCADINGVVIPEIYSAYCAEKVLVTSFCEGVKITNIQAIQDWELNQEEIVERLVFTYCEMILNHGIYHADPHPGNILVNQKGELVILDYGAVGKLEESMRAEIPVFIQAVLYKDNEKLLKSMRKMGFIGKGKNANETAERIIESLSQFITEGINVEKLDFSAVKKSGMGQFSIKELTTTLEVPKDWILLERTLLLLYGICTKLAPDYNPIDTIKPYLKRLVFKEEGLKKIILNAVKHQAGILLGLPKKTDEFLTKANRGELKLDVKHLDLNAQKNRGMAAAFGFVFFAFLCLVAAMYARESQLLGYEKLFKWAGMISVVLLLRQVWINRRIH